jgi:hypothetical protein
MKTKILATSAFLAAVYFPSKAQIIYTDITPDLSFSEDQMYLLDVDNDLTNDYIIEQIDSTISGYPLEGVQLRSLNGNEAVYYTGSLTFLQSFTAGELIDGAEQWTVPSPSLPAGGIITVGSNPVPAGDWINGFDYYAGLRFIVGSNQYYGWVRFSMTTDGLNFTMKDYAYHSTTDQALLAGATVDGIGEQCDGENSCDFSINRTSDLITVTDLKNLDGQFEIYSLNGSLIQSGNVSKTASIELSLLDNGIYMLALNGNSGNTVFRFAVTR